MTDQTATATERRAPTIDDAPKGFTLKAKHGWVRRRRIELGLDRPMEPIEEAPVLTVGAALAGYFHIEDSFVEMGFLPKGARELVAQGKLDHVYVARRLYISRASAKRYVESRVIKATA